MLFTIIVLSAMFPIIVNCMAGVKTVDPSLVRAGRIFGANEAQFYLKIIFPFTLPFIISGINQGISRGSSGCSSVSCSAAAGPDSATCWIARRPVRCADAVRLLLLLAVISVTLVQTLRWLERRVAPWRDFARLIYSTEALPHPTRVDDEAGNDCSHLLSPVRARNSLIACGCAHVRARRVNPPTPRPTPTRSTPRSTRRR